MGDRARAIAALMAKRASFANFAIWPSPPVGLDHLTARRPLKAPEKARAPGAGMRWILCHCIAGRISGAAPASKARYAGRPAGQELTWTGQNNVHRSCSVIWSDVWFVCPARSFGVDKVCLSQYLDSLFAYFLLGPFEMLVSGHSIFQCSS